MRLDSPYPSSVSSLDIPKTSHLFSRTGQVRNAITAGRLGASRAQGCVEYTCRENVLDTTMQVVKLQTLTN